MYIEEISKKFRGALLPTVEAARKDRALFRRYEMRVISFEDCFSQFYINNRMELYCPDFICTIQEFNAWLLTLGYKV